ncbi:MAG: hypothetical protein KGR48_08610 [Alphaproteobacteria bacterium]|nr:hypothetical protein [Alphaproteobacteria bacterium]
MFDNTISLVFAEIKRIWCYRWLVAGVACAVFAVATFYVISLPNVYDAFAQVYTDKETPIAAATHRVSLVGGNYGSPYVAERILLNDDNMQKVLAVLNPDSASLTGGKLEGAINSLRAGIKIDPDQGDGFVQFHAHDNDPVRARDIVRALVRRFIAINVDRNKRDLTRTSEFLDRQIGRYADKLQRSDAAVAAFERSHPRIAQSDTARNTFDATAKVESARADYAAALADRARSSASGSKIEGLRSKLAAMRLQYTDAYPDVIALQRQISALATAGNLDAPSDENGATAAIAAAREKLSSAEAQFRAATEVPPNASRLLAQWAELKRMNALLRDNYEELLSRREATRIAQAVYNDNDTGKYQVVTAAAIPRVPSGPDRRTYLILAAAVSLAAGLSAAFARGVVNGTFVAPRELEVTFGLPVAGTVSWEPAWHTLPSAKTKTNVAVITTIGIMLVGMAGIFVVLAAYTFGYADRFDALITGSLRTLSR